MSSHPLGKSAFDLAGMLPLGFVCGLGAAGADASALTSFDSEFGLSYAWGCLSLSLFNGNSGKGFIYWLCPDQGLKPCYMHWKTGFY